MDSETPDMFIRTTGDVTLVRLKSAKLTAVADVSRITNALHAMVTNGTRKLIIDFKLVEFVSSSTLGMMIALQKEMKDLCGKLIISHPEHIEELLKVSHTAHLFTLASDTRAAMTIITGKK